jgi:uncharacterized iron-regulated membrane protein
MTFDKRLLREVHRWLGLFAGIQLLAWTVSGLYFTLIPIEEIRGDHLLVNELESPLASDFYLISQSELTALHPELNEARLEDFQFLVTNNVPVYLVGETRFDAQTGDKLESISEGEALQIVRARTGFKSESVTFIAAVETGSEYRGGDLPAWKIEIAEENAAIYVSASSGKIRAVRTTSWRLFDFLWSLHIMDYDERDDFNHPLLIFMATLGLITVFSGLFLFIVTQRIRAKQ